MLSISNIESLKNLYAKISGNSSDTINPHTISEAIASTTLDFSKIVGCSGVDEHRLAMEYTLTQKILMKIILYVYIPFSDKIAVSPALYFTITGFID